MKWIFTILFILFSVYTLSQEVDYIEEYSTLINETVEAEKPELYYSIGLAYFYGDKEYGFSKDDRKAVFWLEKAAKNNVPLAQDLMGVAYIASIGVEYNEEKAFYWDLKAARNKVSRAQFRVGNSYSLGRGVLKNYKRSYVWLAIAALSSENEEIKSAAIKERDFIASGLPQNALIEAQDLSIKLYKEIYPQK